MYNFIEHSINSITQASAGETFLRHAHSKKGIHRVREGVQNFIFLAQNRTKKIT